MKFNWGHGIFVFLNIFVLSMVFVVYKSFQQDNALVEKEYYPKGLEYQKQIDRIRNAKAMDEKIVVETMPKHVLITYPHSFKGNKPDGKIFFYRPSDDKGDMEIAMNPDTALVQVITADKLLKGKNLVKLSWKQSGKEFYQEEVIHIENNK